MTPQHAPGFGRRFLLLLTLINLVNYLDRYVVAAVLEPMGKELILDDAQLGRLPLFFVAVYMLSAPLFGWLGDRYHRPRLVSAGVVLWSLATMAAAFAQDYTTLLVSRSLVGVGEAAYASLGPALLSDCYPESARAKKFTWFYLAIPVGSALGYVVGGLLAQHFGWRAAFLIAGAPGLGFAVWMMMQPDPKRGAFDTLPDPTAQAPLGARLRAIFTNRVWLVCTLSYTAYTFAMGALSHWAPSLLQRKFGVSTGDAGQTFGALAVVTGILGTFFGGNLTDRWQRRLPNAGLWLSGVTLLLAAPVVWWSLRADTLMLTNVLFFVAMFLLFVNTSPINALTVSCLPGSIRATGIAVNVLFIHLLGDAVSPEWVGWRSVALTEAGHAPGEALARAMSITALAVALSGAVLWWARRKPDVPQGAQAGPS